MLVLLVLKTSETVAGPVCVFLTILNVLKITVPNNGRLQQLRAEKEYGRPPVAASLPQDSRYSSLNSQILSV